MSTTVPLELALDMGIEPMSRAASAMIGRKGKTNRKGSGQRGARLGTAWLLSRWSICPDSPPSSLRAEKTMAEGRHQGYPDTGVAQPPEGTQGGPPIAVGGEARPGK
jgi:hypothetical protein